MGQSQSDPRENKETSKTREKKGTSSAAAIIQLLSLVTCCSRNPAHSKDGSSKYHLDKDSPNYDNGTDPRRRSRANGKRRGKNKGKTRIKDNEKKEVRKCKDQTEQMLTKNPEPRTKKKDFEDAERAGSTSLVRTVGDPQVDWQLPGVPNKSTSYDDHPVSNKDKRTSKTKADYRHKLATATTSDYENLENEIVAMSDAINYAGDPTATATSVEKAVSALTGEDEDGDEGLVDMAVTCDEKINGDVEARLLELLDSTCSMDLVLSMFEAL